MLTESKVGVASAVHTYYHNMSEDPTPHMAAFMLGQASKYMGGQTARRARARAHTHTTQHCNTV